MHVVVKFMHAYVYVALWLNYALVMSNTLLMHKS